MKSREKFREQVQRNLVALISLFIAVSSLGYNTWRNEKSEYNRNQRWASFEVLLQLGELRELVYRLHYDQESIGEDAARTGWAKVFTIRDLTHVLEAPMPSAAQSLYATWNGRWEGLGSDVASKDAIEDEINSMRDVALAKLRELE
jgi:hypothetical protein